MKLPVMLKKRPWFWFAGTTVVIGGIVIGITYDWFHRSGEIANIDQLTIAVEQKNLQATIEANGTVEPIESVNISPKSSGRIQQLYVEQGDRLQKGDPIAQMENDQLQAEKQQAQANLQQAQAQLAQAQTARPEEIEQARSRLQQTQIQLEQAQANDPQQLEQIRADIESAQSRFELAKQRLERNERLLAEGAISENEFDTIQDEYRNAKANLSKQQQRLQQAKQSNQAEIERLKAEVAELRHNLQQLKNGSREEEKERLQANVASERAQLQQIQTQLDDTLVKAPFTGIVAQKNATEGSFVAPTTANAGAQGTSSTSIVTVNRGLEVLAKVPEADIAAINEEQAVDIVADAFPDQVFQGKVQRISPEAIEQENVTSFEVTITLKSGLAQLQSGMNVNLTFLGEQMRDALMIPTVAVVTQQGETGVIMLNEQQQPQFQPVTLGSTIDNQIQILDGLEPRDRIFIDLPDHLREKVELEG